MTQYYKKNIILGYLRKGSLAALRKLKLHWRHSSAIVLNKQHGVEQHQKSYSCNAINHLIFFSKTINATAKVLKKDGSVIIENVQFPKIRKREKSNYVVVDTDYDNYAVVYNCWQKSMSTREGIKTNNRN